MDRSRRPALLLAAVLATPTAAWGGPLPTTDAGPVAAAAAKPPALSRGGRYMGFAERFNRYYTQPSWKPSRILYVSPTGGGNGSSRSAPMSVEPALAAARPGTLVYFLRGRYKGCHAIDPGKGGTYTRPIVLYGERDRDRSLGVEMSCCTTGRKACFNLEAANYVAIDGFELVGGDYGVRAVGAGYDASQHSRGIAVLNTVGHDQQRDPFFSGQADWAVWENLLAYRAGSGDGHGIYLSNGGDWNIVRFSETHSNASSDFQINADPASTCAADGIAFDDPRCDAYAGTGEGGRGASDYFLIDSNYFHRSNVGPNFTGLRRSIVRNNIFGPQIRHNVSFWQETDNPKLGSRENKVLHNLFITTGRHAVQFVLNSTRNTFANNLLLAVRIDGGRVSSNPAATLMEVDGTVGANVYRSNLYVSGILDGRRPNGREFVRRTLSTAWFTRFATDIGQSPSGFRPTATAPFLEKGTVSADAKVDRRGTVRSGTVDLGPFERP